MFGTGSGNGFHDSVAGVKAKTLVYGDSTLMTEFHLAKDALLDEHSHPHEQTGYLVKGKIKLTIGGSSRILNPGDSWCVPSNEKHKAEILEDSVAVEVFSPCREEYLQYANSDEIIQ